jgi:NRAMP (natural resistance-associated macrophage protein)-like metal ion transporter
MEKIRNYFKKLGPGLVTGASDDDPSGIATYSQTGAKYGFSFLWLSLFTFPLMSVVQEMCARIGMVTGKGLASNIRAHFPRSALVVSTLLLLAANIFNIGADLGAMGKAVQLLAPQFPFAIGLIFLALLSIVLQILVPYNTYSKYLKYLTFVLFSYIITVFFIKIDWVNALSHTIIPAFTFSKDQIFIVCAILGTTISPYLFFWQSSQEVEEEIKSGQVKEEEMTSAATPAEISDMRADVWSGMFVSNLVMFFIILVCGATLHASGITNIESAADAAQALRPFAGNFAFALFAVGIIGTGMLAIPVLAGSAGYAMAEAFNWKEGLYQKPKNAKAFYLIIALAVVVGIFLNFIGLDPIEALIYSAVANGIIAPVILFFIIKISSDKNTMGENTTKPVAKFIGWLTFILMSISAVAVIIGLF